MKLKSGLVLREVAGQFVIVPTGERVREITSVVYISSSAAFLWEHMQNHDFDENSLLQIIMENFDGVSEKQALADIRSFLKTLADSSILEGGAVQGRVYVHAPEGWSPK